MIDIPPEVDAFVERSGMTKMFYMVMGYLLAKNDWKQNPDLKLGKDEEGEYVYYAVEVADPTPFDKLTPITKQFRPGPDGSVKVTTVTDLEPLFMGGVREILADPRTKFYDQPTT